MASCPTSLVSLAIPCSADKDHVTYSSTALDLATAFHDELSRCRNEVQKLQVCCNYRDKILGVSKYADVLAAAFNDAFDPFLRQSGRKKSTEAWNEFTVLVQRQRSSQNREMQLLGHQTSIVAIWGNDVFQHYSWRKLPLDSARLLHSVASKLPQWDLAVSLVNDVLLERHARRIINGQNRAQLIGEHPRGSKIQDPRSPMERQDIRTILSRLKDDGLPVSARGRNKDKTDHIVGTPIRNFGLERDKHGMIVPDGTFGIVRRSPGPAAQARERRRVEERLSHSIDNFDDESTTSLSSQLSSTSSRITGSQLTEFFEEDHNGSTGADFASYEQTMTDEGSGADPLTPDLATNTAGAVVSSQEIPPVAPICNARHSREDGLDTRFLDRDRRVFGSLEQDMELICTQASDVPAVMQAENDPLRSENSVERFLPTCARSFAGASPRASNPDDSSGSLSADHQLLSDKRQFRERHLALFIDEDEEDLFSGRPADSSLSAFTAGQKHHFENSYEHGSPFIRSPELDIMEWQDDTIEHDIHMEVDFGPYGSIPNVENALPTEPGRVGHAEVSSVCHMQSNQGKAVRNRFLDRPDPEGARLGVRVFPAPPTQGELIPTHNGRSTKRLCTDTTVDNCEETVIGRMASRYAGRLTHALTTIQKHGEDRSAREHNDLTVRWLQFTRWADICDVTTDVDSTSEHSLDADVLYMRWDTFQKRALAGEVFLKPIIVKQEFSDSGMYPLEDYMTLLRERSPYQRLDAQDSETRERLSKDMNNFWAEKHDVGINVFERVATRSDAVRLRRIANADAPLLTRMKRFRLLETLVDRASGPVPRKRACRETKDLSDYLGFDLLGFEGVCSSPHIDALTGTWIRCLSGVGAWIFVSGMSREDWDDFAQEGPSWDPADKGRVVVLEKDDVLFLPPGVRVLRSVFTLELSLSEGGILWDEYNIPALLEDLLWVSKRQQCTSEAIPYQLPSVIDALESWIEENRSRLSAMVDVEDYFTAIERGIEKLRDLGCKCVRGCADDVCCPCKAQRRGCTAWCSGNPASIERTRSGGCDCMSGDRGD
jgi:hypothetical protein